MTVLGRRVKVYVRKEPTDMRASYDSLATMAREVLKKDPFSGHLFVFVNKRRNSCKCLFYDGTGFVIIAKRLESGTFSRFNPSYKKEIALTHSEYSLFFEGAAINKRFIESPREIRRGGRKAR